MLFYFIVVASALTFWYLIMKYAFKVDDPVTSGYFYVSVLTIVLVIIVGVRIYSGYSRVSKLDSIKDLKEFSFYNTNFKIELNPEANAYFTFNDPYLYEDVRWVKQVGKTLYINKDGSTFRIPDHYTVKFDTCSPVLMLYKNSIKWHGNLPDWTNMIDKDSVVVYLPEKYRNYDL